jgi:dihydrofolate reductase
MKFRKCIAVSVDGYVASTNGSVAWLDSSHHEQGYDDFVQQINAVVIGRTTSHQAIGFCDLPHRGKRTFGLTSRPIENPPPQTSAWQDGAAKLVEHLRGLSMP